MTPFAKTTHATIRESSTDIIVKVGDALDGNFSSEEGE